MAFTYVLAQLSTTPLYQVRFRLGDVESDSAMFQDEEIQYILSCNHNNILATCIDCIEALLPRLAQIDEIQVGPYSEKTGKQSYQYWAALLKELKGKASDYSTPIMLSPMHDDIFYYDMMTAKSCCDQVKGYDRRFSPP